MTAPEPTDGYPTNDDIGQPVPLPDSTPLAPHVEDLWRGTEVEVQHAESGLEALYDDLLATADSELSDVESGTRLEIAALLGTADAELSAVEQPIYTSVDKLVDTTLHEILLAETELANAGVHVPILTDQIAADLADESGEALVARLQGFSPEVVAPMEVEPTALTGIEDLPRITDDAPPQQPSPAPVRVPQPPVVIPPPDAVRGCIPCTLPDGSPGFRGWPDGPCLPPEQMSACSGIVPLPDVPSAPAPIPAPIPAPAPAPAECPAPVDCGCAPACPAPVINVTCGPPEDSGGGGGGGGGSSEEEEPEPEPEPEPSEPQPEPQPPPAPRIGDVCADPSGQVARWSQGPWYRMSSDLRPEKQSGIDQYWRAAKGITAGSLTMLFGGSADEVKAATNAAYARTGEVLGGHGQLVYALTLLPEWQLPDRRATLNLAATLGLFETAARDSGSPITQLALPQQYLLNWMHPYALPDQSEVDALANRGLITPDRWNCLTRMHGNDPHERLGVLVASQTVLNPHELVALRLRDGLSDASYAYYLRRAGVVDERVQAGLERLAEFVPGASDLVRYMVRDAADTEVVERYQLDKDFLLKFYGPHGPDAPGPMAKWAKALGITEDVMRYYWRSHWDIPSNTALYEMLHRLRPDRPEVIQWDTMRAQRGEEGALEAFGPRPLVVTHDDVRRAIQVNDMSPGWVEPLIAISYRPVNRTDALDAFHSGTIGADELYHAMRDNGYDDFAAKRLVAIQQNKRAIRLSNQSGVWTIRKVLKAYKEGIVDGFGADRLLQPLVIDPGYRTTLIQGADDEVKADVLRAFLKRARRAYFVGEWEYEHTFAQLAQAGVDQRRAVELLAQWDSERLGRYKEPTARLLIQWGQLGIITPDDAYRRLLRLGYNDIDAQRIVFQGIAARAEKVRSEADRVDRRIKEVIKSAKQAEKEASKELKDRLKELEKLAEKQKKERERIEKELEKRGGDLGG